MQAEPVLEEKKNVPLHCYHPHPYPYLEVLCKALWSAVSKIPFCPTLHIITETTMSISWLKNTALPDQHGRSRCFPPPSPASLHIWLCLNSAKASHCLYQCGFGWSIKSGYYEDRQQPTETSRSNNAPPSQGLLVPLPLLTLSFELHLPNILSWLITPWIVKNTHSDCEVSTHISIPRLIPFIPWCTSPFGKTMKLRMSPLLRTGNPRQTTQYSLRSRRKSGSAGSSFVRNVPGSQEVMPNVKAP